MRDPLQLPATVEDRMSLTNRKHGSNHRRSDSPSLLRPTTSAELRENVIGPFIMDNSEAMTRHRHNNRNLRSITPSRLRHSAGGGVPNVVELGMKNHDNNSNNNPIRICCPVEIEILLPFTVIENSK